MSERVSSVVPAGFTIEFSDSAHRYWIDGDHAYSVSSVLKQTVPVDLSDWAKRQAIAGMLALRDEVRVRPVGVNDALNLFSEHGVGPDAHRDFAAARGTAVHDAFEKLGRDEELWIANYYEWEYVDKEGNVSFHDVRGYVRALNKWWLKFSPEVIEQELMVGSKARGYAGRFDSLCIIDGELWLIDLKTSKGVYESHHCQLGLYARALEESGYGMPDRMGVLHVNNDGEYVLHESPKELVLAAADDAFDWFLAKKQLEKKLNALQRGRERERRENTRRAERINRYSRDVS